MKFNSTKSIKSRYSTKIINSNYYGSICISGSTTSVSTTNSDLVFMPYIISGITIDDEYWEKKEKQELRKKKMREIL